MRKFWISVIAGWCLASAAQAQDAAQVTVVASIKPLHSLVAAVMEGSAQAPMLLVEGQQSLHSYALKPSQMQALQRAQLVFYISPEMEMFLEKPLARLPASAKAVEMAKAPGVQLLPTRSLKHFGKEARAHDHDHDHDHDHAHGANDMHLWTSPANGIAMVREIERQLSATFPAEQARYAANAEALVARLMQLDREIETLMQPLKNKPYLVFHDAAQYFEKRYGLRAVGALTLHPERGLAAGHVQALRRQVQAEQVACVFREPQFDAQVVDKLLAKTPARSVAMDPEGALIAPGPGLYETLLRALADAMAQCLAATQ
jgi:zinc transport system substrate-binding protein